MPQACLNNALADFPESSRAYVKGQIAKLESGRHNADDCLWRIASCADLKLDVDAYLSMSNRDRALVRQFISEFLDK